VTNWERSGEFGVFVDGIDHCAFSQPAAFVVSWRRPNQMEKTQLIFTIININTIVESICMQVVCKSVSLARKASFPACGSCYVFMFVVQGSPLMVLILYVASRDQGHKK
jgi:hypothetical protein